MVISTLLSFHYDINGLIVQTDGDGGDSAAREGAFYFHYGIEKYGRNYYGIPSQEDIIEMDAFKNVLNLLQVEPGVFVRNPDHYNDPKDFSRDQTVPLILAMGEMREYQTLKHLWVRQMENGFRYQNGDIGFLEDAGYYIRALREWYLYPVLLLGDVQMLVNSIIRVIKGRDTNDVSDDINHTLALIQAQKVYPTPISYIARKLYKLIKGGIQSRWDWYFRKETGANPFNELYKPLIEKM